MSEIVRTKNEKYELYESLIIQRDTLKREAGSIMTAYVKVFGQLITDSYEKKVECIELKKSIAFCQASVNRGKKPRHKELGEYINRVMQEYYTELEKMIKEHEEAMKSKTSTPETIEKCKKIYKQIAKAIHPDLHVDYSSNEAIMELWNRTVEAYHANNLEELEGIMVLVNTAIEQLGDGKEIEIAIPDIDIKIQKLKAEIEKIKTTEPYIYSELLDDEFKIEAKKTELELEIKEYEKYKEDLEDILASFEFEEGEPCQMS